MNKKLKYIYFSILVLFTLSTQNFSFSQEKEVKEIQNLIDQRDFDEAFDLAKEDDNCQDIDFYFVLSPYEERAGK